MALKKWLNFTQKIDKVSITVLVIQLLLAHPTICQFPRETNYFM
jgi:hypothetical protein